MKYKSEVSQTLDNLENQTRNLTKHLDKGGLSKRDIKDFVKQMKRNVERCQNYVRLEEDDFKKTSAAPAPGSVEAPTPETSPPRKKRDFSTQRVDNKELNENQTERVETDGGHSKKKKNTERVEFDN